METANKKIILPQINWASYDQIIKSIGEQEDHEGNDDDLLFLENLQLLDGDELSKKGEKYFGLRFIKCEANSALGILYEALLGYPPAELIIQMLYGVKSATRDNALTILKSRGFWYYTDETPLTNLLLIMNEVGLIKYSKKFRTVKILYNPYNEDKKVPKDVFIDPIKPYSNIAWLKKILSSCDSYIYWIDKHFQKEALKYIWEIADENKIKEIKILSLDLENNNLNKNAKEEYFRLKKELKDTKNISLTWYIIDSKKIRDTHDRWIICEKNVWNMPNVNAIMSGQRSEINKSNNHSEILKAFNGYFKNAVEVK